jgi:hypothetical protein
MQSAGPRRISSTSGAAGASPEGNRTSNRNGTPHLRHADGTQPDLFAEGLRRRDDGMRTAEHAAHPWVRQALDRAIVDRAATGEPFTADDIRAEVDLLASSPNLLGARINAASRRGLIVRVGFVQSTRPEAHGRHVAQWIGACP